MLETVIRIGPPDGLGAGDIVQIVTALISVLAVGISFAALRAARSDAAAARLHQTQLVLNDQLDRLHQAYLALVRRKKYVRSIPGYWRMDPADREELDLMVATQIMVIDLMFRTNDQRAETWLTFLDFVRGPIWNARSLDLYATEQVVKDYILERQSCYREEFPYDDGLLRK